MIAIELVHNLFSFFFGHAYAEITQTLSEFFNIKFVISTLINLIENSSETSDSKSGPFANLSLDISKQVFNIPFCWRGHSWVVRRIWRQMERKYVLISLLFCRIINS